jgi:DNA recombination protein RmuC
LGKSFELVSKRLMEVQNGLGEMKTLANGVGDLKKVLSNVKTRGVLGEIQLGNILEQLLTPEQYGLNVATIPDSACHVEFAIKLPGREIDDKPVWLPIDSKFPMDKYHHLQEAYEAMDTELITKTSKDLFNTIKSMAKDIRDKYIAPPHTTDFGILFLPTEGLYADVVRNTDLIQFLQREYKIMVAGPTNLAALLNSLQMGFRSLAIEKRTSEVWKILSSVKTEFGKFGGVLDKVQTKLRQASDTIDKVGVRSRAIERQLRTVESLPEASETAALPFDDGVQIEDFIDQPILS